MDLSPRRQLIAVAVAVVASAPTRAQDAPNKVTASWDQVNQRLERRLATLQVVVNPPLRRGTRRSTTAPSRTSSATSGADYVRFVPWLPYPAPRRRGAGGAREREDIVGFLADRPHDHRLSGGHQGPSRWC